MGAFAGDSPRLPPARGARALSRAPAPGSPARPGAHAPPARPLRGGRGWASDRLHQCPRPRALSHGVEPLRSLRPRALRPDRLSPALALRVLGTRGVPGTRLLPALVAPGHARL